MEFDFYVLSFSVGLGTDQVDSFNPPATLGTNLYHSQSNPDLVSISYDDSRCTDCPEHVLKVSLYLKFICLKLLLTTELQSILARSIHMKL